MRRRSGRGIRRNRSREYKSALQTVMASNETLEYHSYIQQLETDWNEQFTNPEKYGYGPTDPGPINFGQFLRESLATLEFRRDKDLPENRANGNLIREEFDWNMDLVNQMIEFNKRKLGELGVETK